MGQTGVIFFGLLVGFVVWITIKGELTGYMQVIGLKSGGNTNCSGSGTTNTTNSDGTVGVLHLPNPTPGQTTTNRPM
jgi:hypothetical protein